MIDFQSIFQDKSITEFNDFSQSVFDKLARCHTAKMGVHRLRCNEQTCGKEQYQFHNCGNRNCPNCGGLKKEEWIDNRMQELLPTPYYHLVFTLPHQLNPLILGNRKLLFKLLFDAAWQTILSHSKQEKYLGATTGVTMVLHSWGQDLSFHPHVHCIVTGGGFDGTKWIAAKRQKNNFLFPETSLQNEFKAIFLKQLLVLPIEKQGIDVEKMANELEKIRWNVYAKAPFGGPEMVVKYLGRYTHKIGITKHRIVGLSENTISFRYKDYADGNKQKTMTLTRVEFLRRFELHILPKRFTKIRHYGFLQNHGKAARLHAIRTSLGLSPMPTSVKIPVAIRMLEKYGKDIFKCPCCATGRLELVSSRRYFASKTQEMQAIETIITRNKASPANKEQQK
jgi:hypothetical protein